MTNNNQAVAHQKTIVLGGGCFWCLEAIFNQLEGVQAIPGYAGGETKNPSYKEVCRGDSGHAEVVQITYDQTKITLEQILVLFFQIHDPTTINRQGNDVGSQYRSIIFYNNPEEKAIIESAMAKAQQQWKKKIVTEVQKFTIFYRAEEFHQHYFEKNPTAYYCSLMILPKLVKLQKILEQES